MTTSSTVPAGHTTTGGTVSSGDEQDVYGQTVGVMVVGGGTQVVETGGSATNTEIDGGLQLVESSATATNTRVFGGDQVVIGTAMNTTISGEGTQTVYGSAVDTTLSAGGTQIIEAGGSVTYTTFSGGTQIIDVGASLAEQIIPTRGDQFVYGSAFGTTIESGGFQYVLSGGKAILTTIDSGGSLEVNDSESVANGTIVENGGSIILGYVAYAPGGTANLNSATDILTVTDGGNTYTEQLAGSYANEYFHLSSQVLSSSLEITAESTPCYCRGTLILTEAGEVSVEQLAIGDRLMTASGALRPIKWIGKRRYGGRFALGNRDIMPICFKAGSLDDKLPCRDLWVSPKHAMFFDGVLIPAECLVNGVSIVRVQSVDLIEYFHLELDSHDVIVAEGALSESFIDDDSRGLFHNAHEFPVLYPDAVGIAQQYCAPRMEDGYIVEAVRRRLAQQAGLTGANQDNVGALRGYLDHVAEDRIAGWAQNFDHPEAPVCLDIFAEGCMIGQTLANRYRDDLERAGLGSGRHAFQFAPPPDLASAQYDKIEVRRSADGTALASRPMRKMRG